MAFDFKKEWNNDRDKNGVRSAAFRAFNTLDRELDHFSAQPDMSGIFAIVNKTA